MRFIVKDIETGRYYVLNAEEGTVEQTLATEKECREYIKRMLFNDFYYSAIDIHGRTQTPNPTKHYWDVFTSVKGTHIANYFFQVPMSKASGWTYYYP